MSRSESMVGSGQGSGERLTRKRPIPILVVFAAALAMVLGACQGPADSGNKKQAAKTVVMAMNQGSLRTLDPNNAYEPEWFVIGHQMYQTLVSFEGDDVSKVTPLLAEKWSVSPDGKTYTFDLDQRAKFSDGAPVTAEDVVFSLMRFKNTQGPGAWLVDNMEGATAESPTQVNVTLAKPDVSFLAILTSPSLGIVNAKTVRAQGGTDAADAAKTDKAQPWLNEHSAGSGPFVLKNWQRNEELVLERNPNYWGTAPDVERVSIKFVGDTNSQLQTVQRGDADIALDLTPDQIAGLPANGPVQVARTAALGVMYLGWTADAAQDPALAKRDNWDAIRYALDYSQIVELAKGAGERAPGIVPGALAGGLDESKAVTQDLDAARAALAKAGNPDGFEFTMAYASQSNAAGVSFDVVAQKIQSDLKNVGITVKLKPELQAQFYSDYRGGKLPAVLHWWLADYADALNFLPVFVPPGSVAETRQHWPADAQNKELVELAESSLSTTDEGQRAQIVQQAQTILNTTGPYAPLIDLQRQVAYNAENISDLVPNPIWVVDFAHLTTK
ncbi:MAG TPA: ABC transporter substrate-binding protein [Mycobacteriales bacterium]